MPRIEELAALCRVVEEKSFSRAAKALGLTQPAVSLQIKSLEEEYGTQLLHRQGREITPTECGRIVYAYACQITNLYDRSRLQLQEIKEAVSGSLLVGASSGPGEHLLPLLLGQFKAQHPGVAIALRVGDSSEILEHVLMRRLELGFVGSMARDRHLQFVPFLHDELVLVVHPGHALAGRKSIPHEELLQVPLLLQQRGSGARTVLGEELSRYDIECGKLNVVMELGLQESTKAAVRSKLGATIISRLGALEELGRGDLVEVPIEGIQFQRQYYVTYLKTSPLTNLATAFLEFALQGAEGVVAQIREGVAG
jgi:DNA-binding transcriptional LysR family regulator